MVRRIAILGSTGSIGTQTLDVVRSFPEEFDVAALTTHRSVDELKEQAREFNPDILGATADVVCPDDWVKGEAGLATVAEMELDLLVLAVVGTIGLKPCLTALQKGTDVGLATKEVLVAGGPLVNEAREGGGDLLPLDSEHHALAQLLDGEPHHEVKRIILTASGGPFRDREDDLADVTPEEALDHPNWNMGPKITIDSATMMNKGLELIEARYLFDFPPEMLQALIHPQSTVHGLVEFKDHSLQAHMSVPDMKLTLQSALFHPERREAVVDSLSFDQGLSLDFAPVDPDRYPAYALARRAMRQGGGKPAVLNAANKTAVDAFLNEQIAFTEIPQLVEDCLDNISHDGTFSYESIRTLEESARRHVRSRMTKK